MATTYDASTFDLGVLPGGLHKDALDLCQGGIALGWKIAVKNMMVRLISPDSEHTIVISASNKNIPYERHKRTIYKHGNPLIMDRLLSTGDAMGLAQDTIIAQDLATKKREQREAQDHQEIERIKADRKATKEAKVSVRKLIDDGAVLVTSDNIKQFISADEDLDLDAKYVVSEVPMMAHSGQRKGYISPTTNERTWSDGSVDFTCRSAQCDYSTDDRTGVGRHWRTHVKAGVEQSVDQPRQTYVTPPHEPVYERGYTPRRDRVSGLAAVLAALDLAAMTSEEIAEFILNWEHEQSNSGSRMAAEREELTSDEVLNRIRSLLDNGTYLNQQEEIASLRAETDSLGQSLTEAMARAQQAEERWTTLRELISMDEGASA